MTAKELKSTRELIRFSKAVIDAAIKRLRARGTPKFQSADSDYLSALIQLQRWVADEMYQHRLERMNEGKQR